MAHVKIFLSTVSAEFRTYRDSLRHDLDRPNVTVKVQEDFIATGTETLDKLDEYISQCDAVVHLVGDMIGSLAQPPSVAVIHARYPDFARRLPMLHPFLAPNGPALPYTQWEAWLALYHNKVLIIATPEDGAPRDGRYQLAQDQREAQQSHLARLAEIERYPEIRFINADRLAVDLWRSKLLDLLATVTASNAVFMRRKGLGRIPDLACMERVRAVASQLLEVGRVNWNAPQFVAVLNLQAQEEEVSGDGHPTTICAAAEAVGAGANLSLFGVGGIGKTTFLIELSGIILAEKLQRVPLYIDAAYWARTNTEILDYIAGRPAAQLHGVTVGELVTLADAGCLTIVVNGWNEIPAGQKSVCLERFSQLTTTMQALNVVVVTRAVMDAPNLRSAKQIQVRGLTWQSQSELIHAELDDVLANTLIELLARDTRLRHAARSPLILKGLLAKAKKGEVLSSSVFDLLGAVVEAFEEDNQRRHSLEEPPLRRQQHHYLEALACHLTAQQETTTSRQEMLPVISVVAAQLVDRGILSRLPDPSEVLDALCSHHLIQVDEHVVRFAHHRFQEYYAACRLQGACINAVEGDVALLRDACNEPFWEDALQLFGGKLKGEDAYTQARIRLVTIALKVDLGLACDLARACAFSDADDRDLYCGLVANVNAMCDSPLREVADYGIVCLIASGFTVFADRLWPLIESENRETRFNTFRLNALRISLKQLGATAETRIAGWSPERRAELIHELADNPDNYDFLVRAANEAVENVVRAAAISALGWNFPASETTFQAWLKAPVAVQLEHSVIGIVEDALEQGVCSDAVRNRLRILALEHPTDKSQLRLALAFPEEVGPSSIDFVFARLRDIQRHGEDASLVALATKCAPDRLKALAQELVLAARTVPKWACKLIQEQSAASRAEVFEAAWAVLDSDDARNLNAEAVGPLASRGQTLRSVREWVKHCQERRVDLPEAKRERVRQLGFLLANAPGDDLLSVVMELGESASYGEASELLDLVLRRIGGDGSRPSESTQWMPSLDAVRALIALFGKQSTDETVPQYKVRISLCSIASHVAPAEFGPMLLDVCHLHLDSWEMFDAAHREWLNDRRGLQPRNPGGSSDLVSALQRWGFGALPALLELFGHPHANHLILDSVARIVSSPWASKKEDTFPNRDTAWREGEQRRLAGRVLHQPDDRFQELTDAAARALGVKLTNLVHQLRDEQVTTGAKWNEKQAAYRMRGLLTAVANTPSPEIAKPLMYALASGFADVYGVIGALQGWLSQGVFIEDAAVVDRIETVFAAEAQANWFDDSARYVMAQLCQQMFFVRPASLLRRPLSDYVVDWERFTYRNDVIRILGAIPSEEAWRCLLKLGRILATDGNPPEELALALASSLTPDHFDEFLSIVADGTWFGWCQSHWNLERIAPSVVRVIEKDVERLDAFVAACERSASPFADGFACAVLTGIPDGDAVRLRYGLAILDKGKVEDSRWSGYSMLKGMFTLHIPLDGAGSYEVHPKSCSELRRELYTRAKENGRGAPASRRLLAEVECQRWESGRPTDESRHPIPDDGIAWTEALVING